MMTTQERFRTTSRRLFSVIFAGLATALASAVAGIIRFGPPALGMLFIVGFAVCVAATLFGYFAAFRCPNCRGNVSSLFMNKMDRQPVRFCPYCGLDFYNNVIDQD